MQINLNSNLQQQKRPSFQAFVVTKEAKKYFHPNTIRTVENKIKTHPIYSFINAISEKLGGDIVLSRTRPNDPHYYDTDLYFVSDIGHTVLQRRNISSKDYLCKKTSAKNILTQALKFSMRLLMEEYGNQKEQNLEIALLLNKAAQVKNKVPFSIHFNNLKQEK